MVWLTGSVGAAHWSDVANVAAGLTVAVPLLVVVRGDLRQLALDPDTARMTGLPLGRAQAGVLLLAVALTALAVSQVGAVGFVGLIAPHAARLAHGEFTPAYLISTALIGGLLLLGADTLGRILVPPYELPAGALTALIGAPLFLWLLMRERRAHA
jgi:iron complex transport system permease protein